MKRKFEWLTDGTSRTVITLLEADFRKTEPRYLWDLFESNGSVKDSRVWILALGAEEPIHVTFEQLLTVYPSVSTIADELQRILEEGDPNCYVRVTLNDSDIILALRPYNNRRCFRFHFLSSNECRVDKPDAFYDGSEESDAKWSTVLEGTWDEGLKALTTALTDKDLEGD